MDTTLLRVAESVKKLKPSKWLLDERHLAARLGISAGQLATFSRCIEGGGIEVDGTWRSNPSPFDTPIDLFDTSSNNALRLHQLASRCSRTCFPRQYRRRAGARPRRPSQKRARGLRCRSHHFSGARLWQRHLVGRQGPQVAKYSSNIGHNLCVQHVPRHFPSKESPMSCSTLQGF